MSKIVLVPVSKENWVDCSYLKAGKGQEKNVASCLATIAESKFETHYELRAIEREGKIVGMLAYCPEVDEPTQGLFWIFRLLIDEEFQRKGYGAQAIRHCLEEIERKDGVVVRIMCKPGNSAAIRCYETIGFTRKGYLEDGDILYELKVRDNKSLDLT